MMKTTFSTLCLTVSSLVLFACSGESNTPPGPQDSPQEEANDADEPKDEPSKPDDAKDVDDSDKPDDIDEPDEPDAPEEAKPYCGDGEVNAKEQCDDGANGDPCDGCLDDCTKATPSESPVFTGDNLLINEPTVWCKEISPVVLPMTTLVKDATLWVGPGVRVEFPLDGTLLVRSQLRALGSKEEPVTFTSVTAEPNGWAWDGLYIATDQRAGALFAHSIVEYAEIGVNSECCFNQEPEHLLDGTVVIQSSTFRNNWRALDGYTGRSNVGLIRKSVFMDNDLAIGGADRKIIDSEFSGNATAISAERTEVINSWFHANEVAIEGADCVVRRSLIVDNTIAGVIGDYGTGIELTENTILRNGIGVIPYFDFGTFDSPPIWGNTICDSTQYNLQLDFAADVDVSGNYWCSEDEDEIAASIYDVYDELTGGEALFDPFLKKPSSKAPVEE